MVTSLKLRNHIDTVIGKEERSLKNTASIIVTLVIIILIFFSLRYVLETSVPLAVVSSWSMDPTLHVGDLVVVKGVRRYNIGEIIVYDSGHNLIVHRIISLKNSNYITKGDANPYPDLLPIPPAKVKGKVVLVIPYLGIFKLIVKRLRP